MNIDMFRKMVWALALLAIGFTTTLAIYVANKPPRECPFEQCKDAYEEGFSAGFAEGVTKALSACNGS